MKIKWTINIELYWAPEHEGIPLNEQTDAAVGKVAEDQTNPVRLKVSLSFLKARAREMFTKRGVPLNRPPCTTSGHQIADALDRLEKGQVAVSFQLRSGHSPLRQYLKRIKAENTAAWPHCGLTESTAHFLVYCEKICEGEASLLEPTSEGQIQDEIQKCSKAT
ncbi:hypothetical protein CROQUDRAFT_87327 [Cronartium quercuum f. sp. fusiforme G11]|uniref:RNase H type-1 domain-containing protein n=1 Tax=Cronartium quercuum f. sp. fusiforme G11 TaxID=708437 RepID=A0A9P6TFY1_9BASI|nr:hypothetical protein CROQUDRAFT_87327 [Cronartium quercuum f. sp. fusiforme G11]